MAVTTQNSTQMGNLLGSPRKVLKPHELGGRLRLAFFAFEQSGAGDANSIARLVELPAGQVRVILPLSRIHHSAFGTSRTLDLGHAAYTDLDGDTVAADEDDLDAAVDVSSAGSFNPAGTIGTHETKVFASLDGVTIEGKVKGGTIPDEAKLSGYLVYVHD